MYLTRLKTACSRCSWLHLSLLLLGLMVSLPFLQPIHHKPLAAFYEEILALTLGVLALFSFFLHGSMRSPRPLQLWLPSILMLPALLLLATVLQLAGGMLRIPMLGLFQSAYLVWATALICLAASLRQQLGLDTIVQMIAAALLAGALASAFSAFAQRLELGMHWYIVFPSFGRVYGNLGQANLLTTQLWLGLCSLLYFHQKKRVRSGFMLMGLFFIAAACGMTASRMAWLHGLVMLALAVLIWRRQSGKACKALQEAGAPSAQLQSAVLRVSTLWFLGGSLALIIAAGEVSRALPWQHAAEQQSALDRLRVGLASGDARLDIWRDTLTMIEQHPWLGGGVGNYSWNNAVASAQAPANAPTFAGAEHAHNFLLQTAADYGLPLTLVVSAFVLFWFYRAVRTAPSAEKYLLLALLALIFIHSQLEYPLWYADYLGLTAVLLGLLGASGRALALPRRWIMLAVCLVSLFGMALLYRDYRTLDEALIIYRSQVSDEAAQKRDWQRRMAIYVDLATRSMLAPYARGTLAVLMTPNAKEARPQAIICESAMHLWASAGMLTQCAVLRHMLGQTVEAEKLYAMVKKAYRRPDDQAVIEAMWKLRLVAPATESQAGSKQRSDAPD